MRGRFERKEFFAGGGWGRKKVVLIAGGRLIWKG